MTAVEACSAADEPHIKQRLERRAEQLAICSYLRRFDRGVMGYKDDLTDVAFVKTRMTLAESMGHLAAPCRPRGRGVRDPLAGEFAKEKGNVHCTVPFGWSRLMSMARRPPGIRT